VNDAERVAVVRSGVADWNDGEIDALVERFEPDGWLRLAGAFPGLKPIYRGHEGYREFFEDFREPWTRIVLRADEVEPLRPFVFAALGFHGVGREGIEVDATFFFLFEFGDGRIAAWRAFVDRDEALAAADRASESGHLDPELPE
jgi:ketosteroid isomerase-like protein